MFQREDVLRGGHAGAAVEGGVFGRRAAQQYGEAQPQFFLRSKCAVGVEVVGVGGADRAEDVTRDRIDRFVFTAIPFGRARVE